MDVHQACIGVIVRELNKYSNVGGEVQILCPGGKTYSMLIIVLCLALMVAFHEIANNFRIFSRSIALRVPCQKMQRRVLEKQNMSVATSLLGGQ